MRCMRKSCFLYETKQKEHKQRKWHVTCKVSNRNNASMMLLKRACFLFRYVHQHCGWGQCCAGNKTKWLARIFLPLQQFEISSWPFGQNSKSATWAQNALMRRCPKKDILPWRERGSPTRAFIHLLMDFPAIVPLALQILFHKWLSVGFNLGQIISLWKRYSFITSVILFLCLYSILICNAYVSSSPHT